MDRTEDPQGEARVQIRPSNFEAVKPYTDLLDRKYPHTLNPFLLLRLAVQQGMVVDTVPPEFWSQEVNDEGFTVADVACPCGESPRVEVLSMALCPCERTFFFSGEAVTVVNSQKRSQADPDTGSDAAA